MSRRFFSCDAVPVADRPETRWCRDFVGAIEEVGVAARWIGSIATGLSLPEEQAHAMQICLEELMSNIVRHGGVDPTAATNRPEADVANPLLVSISINALPDRIVLTVEDNGRPFDVVQAPSRGVEEPLESVQPGGLGIHLVKKFASSLRYCRTENGNRVIVEFTT